MKKFEKLSEEKKQKILQSALIEFSTYGYENASTNRIVERAEISKGALFHYFKSKKGLYLYLIDYVIPLLYDEFYRQANMTITNFFERIKNWQAAKLNIMDKMSLETKFLIKAFTNIPKEVKDDVLTRYAKYTQDGFKMLFENIDFSMFKEDIDKNKAIETIVWTLESYGNKYMKENVDSQGNIVINKEKILSEIEAYLNILKFGIAKPHE
ncbi:HTH-type transcriptional regulator BetI [Caloramator mitchellensis]|uniref:HTH-type transcriptional regulator BetI n=1 Tax=Caloramator mitchellensis TaxID=908809 RepID=A0A0R3JXU4_CALMK|nr:TetR/AcrR family transcriptional regulator [Caloramator mitchellensis]KRQ87149.1 HTH-type transcriptional regulator BetI [Caloramator mitchellensis]